MGELWSTVVMCGENSNLALVNSKGDPMSVGGMGGIGGLIVSCGVDTGGTGVSVARGGVGAS